MRCVSGHHVTSVGILVFAHRLRWRLIWVSLIPLQAFRVRKEEHLGNPAIEPLECAARPPNR
jgi:hypothetical protein